MALNLRPNSAPSEPTTQKQLAESSDTAHVLWKILTRFDSTKLTPYQAFRNAAGVVLPLIGGYALGMPRGGLAIASGALNVSYSDGSDSYAVRAKRMLSSTVLCAVAVFAGAIAGKHQVAAISLATTWAFIAGMMAAIGGAAPDLGVISLVTLLIYAAQPLTPHEAAISGILALAGGLLQTFLSVALWPVHRYDPERRVLGSFYLELAYSAAVTLNAAAAPLASSHSEQAQESLSGLGRDSSAESMRYRALLNQGERIRLSLLMLLRLRLRMERESGAYSGIEILSAYLVLAARILRRISNFLLDISSADEQPQIGQLDELTRRLREQAAATSTSFLGAVAKHAVFQMDALSGQLRAAFDLATNNAQVDAPGFRNSLHRGHCLKSLVAG